MSYISSVVISVHHSTMYCILNYRIIQIFTHPDNGRSHQIQLNAIIIFYFKNISMKQAKQIFNLLHNRKNWVKEVLRNETDL